MNTEYKHLIFTKQLSKSKSRKTEVWSCENRSEQYLGMVSWYSPWRQYCWFQEDGGMHSPTVMAASCLDDLSHFIKQLMDQRKGK